MNLITKVNCGQCRLGSGKSKEQNNGRRDATKSIYIHLKGDIDRSSASSLLQSYAPIDQGEDGLLCYKSAIVPTKLAHRSVIDFMLQSVTGIGTALPC